MYIDFLNVYNFDFNHFIGLSKKLLTASSEQTYDSLQDRRRSMETINLDKYQSEQNDCDLDKEDNNYSPELYEQLQYGNENNGFDNSKSIETEYNEQ